MLKISSSHLPHLPALFSEYPLPPDICVPEPLLLRFFSTFVEDLPAEQGVSAGRRYDASLRMAFIGMLVSALASDYYWTDRSVLLPEVTLEFLRESAATGFPDVLWVEGASRGYFTFQDVVTRGSALQYVALKRMFVRQDMREKETTLFEY